MNFDIRFFKQSNLNNNPIKYTLSEINNLKNLYGGKGANLILLSENNIPVPPGFVIPTTVAQEYFENNLIIPNSISKEVIKKNIEKLELDTGKSFGANNDSSPLLISVRSGAKTSMPGMMDTILNLGMNNKVRNKLAIKFNDELFAADCYKRFIEMFSAIVHEFPIQKLFDIEKELLTKFSKVSVLYYDELITQYKDFFKERTGDEFPEDPYIQLEQSIHSVIKSCNSNRAKVYRDINNIENEYTAVIIQSMVFGNLNEQSGTGVIFTRNPLNGNKELFGEYMPKAQGEDIVSGKKNPFCLNEGENSLKNSHPLIYKDIEEYCWLLESYFKEMQDIEFTVEDGKTYILQSRTGKRSAAAAFKIAYDFVQENLLTKEEAIISINPNSLDLLLHDQIDKSDDYVSLSTGLAASPGAASGIIVLNSDEAEEKSSNGNVILVRSDTSPDDIKGMSCASGILTSRGGLTSHAAVVARGLGKPCICGATDLIINEENNYILVGQEKIYSGEMITIDGSSGEIYKGKLPVIKAKTSFEFEEILKWCDGIKRLKVYANAETSHDLEVALKFSAEGIGLCRTEHMFFTDEKIGLVQKMIIAPSVKERGKILEQLLPLHTNDFKELFALLNGKTITVRLLDPPLHEFLPKKASEISEWINKLDLDFSEVEPQLERLHEENPMLGHRGARLGITHPDIYMMQVQALFTAAIQSISEGLEVNFDIMLPFIMDLKELEILKKSISEVAHQIMVDYGKQITYRIGTMIELPRAALIANQLAQEADFFSFGTNDLTQTTYGISRDDMAKFMPDYKLKGIFKNDPFNTIEENGIGGLISHAIKLGKSVNNNLECGVCGEHGGDPLSIAFCDKIGLDYVSCSPFRIPKARVAAARATILNNIHSRS